MCQVDIRKEQQAAWYATLYTIKSFRKRETARKAGWEQTADGKESKRLRNLRYYRKIKKAAKLEKRPVKHILKEGCLLSRFKAS